MGNGACKNWLAYIPVVSPYRNKEKSMLLGSVSTLPTYELFAFVFEENFRQGL